MAMNCCVCHRQALSSWGGKAYCLIHLPTSGRDPTFSEVVQAREMMAGGQSLKEAAASLGVLSSNLDVALFRYLGDETPRRYVADF